MIELKNISKTFYPGTEREVQALKNISLSAEQGNFIVVMGGNGSGKSTLLNVLGGSLTSDTGEIFIGENNFSGKKEFEFSPHVSRIFQNPFSGTAPALTIIQNLRLAALRNQKKKFVIGIDQDFRKKSADVLKQLNLGLENKLDTAMENLSGGQRQAVTLLMAVMQPPKLLLMDEPTAALDPRTSEIIMRMANDIIRQYQLTAILVTHSMKEALSYGNRIILMEDGSIKKDLNGSEKSNLQLKDVAEWFA